MLGEGESGIEIFLHHFVVDVLHESGINILLQLLSSVSEFLGWCLALEELVRSGLLGVLLLESLVTDII